MKRYLVTLLILLLLAPSALAEAPVTRRTVVYDLLDVYDLPSRETEKKLEKDLKALNDPLMDAVAVHWERIFIDPYYPLYDADEDDLTVLEITDPSTHVFVIMGYCLKDGKMEEELKRRCEAAAKAARAFPDTSLICTGGETGVNNPDHHTEAGLMRDYLVKHCGIDASRIYIDTRSRTTQDNVINTFRILREEGKKSITVVTSGYHQRWATMLFCAEAEAERLAENPTEIEIIGNWCCIVDPPTGYNQINAEITAAQLAGLLSND